LQVFEPKFSQNWDSCAQYHEKWFQPALNSEVPGSRPNSRIQISLPEYLGKDIVFRTFVFLMFQDKNLKVAPPVTPKGKAAAGPKI
jgi:hypothetical protein